MRTRFLVVSSLALIGLAARLIGATAEPPTPIPPVFLRADLVVVARLTAVDLSIEPEGWALARVERTIKGTASSPDILFSPGYTLTAGNSYLLFLQPAKPRFPLPTRDRLFSQRLPFFKLLNDFRRAFPLVPRLGLSRPHSSDPVSNVFQVDTEFWVVPESLRQESIRTETAGGWPVSLIPQEPMLAYLRGLLESGRK